MNSLNHLTKRSATWAWAVCFLDRQEGGHITVGELRERYEADTRMACFLPHERDPVREGLARACQDFLGAVCVTNGLVTDDMIFEGIGFRPRQKLAGKPVLCI